MGGSFWSGAGGGLIGALGALGGSAVSYAVADRQAHKQRQFLRKMRGTAYQATMADMKKAGLNPILAYRTGPTPLGGSPSLPQIPDFGSAAARGAAAGADISRAGTQRREQESIDTLRRNQMRVMEEQMGVYSAQAAHYRNLAKREELGLDFDLASFMPRLNQAANSARHIGLQNRVLEGDVPAADIKAKFFGDPTFGTPAWTAKMIAAPLAGALLPFLPWGKMFSVGKAAGPAVKKAPGFFKKLFSKKGPPPPAWVRPPPRRPTPSPSSKGWKRPPVKMQERGRKPKVFTAKPKGRKGLTPGEEAYLNDYRNRRKR